MEFKTRQEALTVIGEHRYLLHKQVDIPVIGTDEALPYFISEMLSNNHPQKENQWTVFVHLVGSNKIMPSFWLELEFITIHFPNLSPDFQDSAGGPFL